MGGSKGRSVETKSAYGPVAAIIPAAGAGRRMGGTVPKQFLQIGGREVLARTLAVFETCVAIDDIWVVVAAEQCPSCQSTIVERYGLRKVRGVIAGGATRQESVWRGLQQVHDTVQLVVVHDGVRPFVTEPLLQQTLAYASCYGAAIAAVPLKDTLKRVSVAGTVEATVPRERLWRVQTPQAFRHTLLRQAFQHAWRQGLQATDEAGLIEALGYPVQIVPGYEHNIKITTPDDLVFCETFLRE
jgi:2-C-methyl-D-erythritol 4-phosphate cytidylyltransferase